MPAVPRPRSGRCEPPPTNTVDQSWQPSRLDSAYAGILQRFPLAREHTALANRLFVLVVDPRSDRLDALPAGVLDHFKFTDGLVGHSLLAMAGFVSSLLIFVMVQLLGDDGWIFNGTWSFYVWQVSVFAYVLIMFFAGWREGSDPVCSFVPDVLRNGIYTLRLFLGILILLASLQYDE